MYISTFNFSPKYTSIIDKIAFPKNPVTNVFKSNVPFNVAEIPPYTESRAATIEIATYEEYVYGINGKLIPIIAPNIHPIIIAKANIIFTLSNLILYILSLQILNIYLFLYFLFLQSLSYIRFCVSNHNNHFLL